MAKRPKNKKLANSHTPKKTGKKNSVRKEKEKPSLKKTTEAQNSESTNSIPFFQRRSKVGRPRLFENPADLAQAFLDYTQEVDENPLIEEDFVGGGFSAGQIVYLRRKRPYTLMGFCIYIDAHLDYLNQFKRSLKPKEREIDAKFNGVIAHIEQVCYTQKFEGAAAGFFNANIISRDLGLADKKILNAEKPIVIDWGDDKQEKQSE